MFNSLNKERQARLIDWITNHLETEFVYFNSCLEWSFHPRKYFDTKVSRADILDPKKEVEETKNTNQKIKNK